MSAASRCWPTNCGRRPRGGRTQPRRRGRRRSGPEPRRRARLRPAVADGGRRRRRADRRRGRAIIAVPRERRRSAHRPRSRAAGPVPAPARVVGGGQPIPRRSSRSEHDVRRPGQPGHLVAQLPFRRQRRLPTGVRRRTGARAAAHHADGERADRVVSGPPARGCGVGGDRRSPRCSRRAEAPPPGGASTSPSCWTGNAAPTAGRWAGRWPSRRSTTSPTTTGMSTAGRPRSSREPPGTQIKADPSRLVVFKDYVRNVATWLQPTTTRYPSPVAAADSAATNLR